MANFSESIVNQRFKLVYTELERANKIKGKSDIAKHLGTYNHVINSILKGERNITVDQLNKLFDIFKVNANYLFGISDDLFLPGYEGSDIAVHGMSERNQSGRRNITLVPNRALAGYALEHQQDNFMEELPKFSVPNLEGDLVAFEIIGDSMMPTITNGDIVVCEPIERGISLRDNHVYVVVTDVVVAKRIQQGRGSDKMLLISDNSDVYKPYPVNLDEVRQLLKVRCRLTSHAIS